MNWTQQETFKLNCMCHVLEEISNSACRDLFVLLLPLHFLPYRLKINVFPPENLAWKNFKWTQNDSGSVGRLKLSWKAVLERFKLIRITYFCSVRNYAMTSRFVKSVRKAKSAITLVRHFEDGVEYLPIIKRLRTFTCGKKENWFVLFAIGWTID